MRLIEIALSLPYPVQRPLKYVYEAIPLSIRYGKAFRETYALLQESQWWSREKLEEYQMQQLSRLLDHAYENVPYYRRIFDERGLKPKHIQDFNDFRKLPYLTKDNVRENLHDLMARNIPEKGMQYVTTSGSTGIPLGLYIERKTNQVVMAFEWREWNWMGYKFGDRCAVLRGNVVKREENGQKAWWEYDKANNYLILSTYDMTDYNLPYYARKIEEFKPRVIQGYPSALDILTRFIRDNNLTVNAQGNIIAISTSSENLYPAQRQMIEETFKCRVFDKYGNSEQVTILGECERHEGYHDFMEYSYTEILDEDANPVTEDGIVGEIVGTAFTNYAMPFIRYKTGDLVEYTTHRCSCGRQLPLVKRIEGRVQDFIIDKNGGLMSLSGLRSRILRDLQLSTLREFQFLQETLGELTIRAVKNHSCSDEKAEAYILDIFSKRLRGRCKLKVKFVEHIPRTQRGKFKFLIQKLDIKL